MKHGYILLPPRKIFLYPFIFNFFYSSLFFAVIGGYIKKENKIKIFSLLFYSYSPFFLPFPSSYFPFPPFLPLNSSPFFSFKSLSKSFIKMVPSVTWRSNLQVIFISFFVILILFDLYSTIAFQIYFIICSLLSSYIYNDMGRTKKCRNI